MLEVRFLPDPITSHSSLWFFYELHVRQTVHRDSRLTGVEVLDVDTGRRLLMMDWAFAGTVSRGRRARIPSLPNVGMSTLQYLYRQLCWLRLPWNPEAFRRFWATG